MPAPGGQERPAGAERLATDPARVPGAKEQAARSALNGVFGDSLVAAGSSLAVQMGLHAGGAPLALTAGSLASLRPRVCVFIHGLACDEQSWRLRNEAWSESVWAQTLGTGQAMSYGALLEHELGVSAIDLRYNSGLSIEASSVCRDAGGGSTGQRGTSRPCLSGNSNVFAVRHSAATPCGPI